MRSRHGASHVRLGSMSQVDRGRRAEDGAWEWKMANPQGEERLIRHFAPDRSRHFYEPRGHNESIPLFRGRFCTPKEDADELAYDGEVWLTWLPNPKVIMAGGRKPGTDSFDGLRDSLSPAKASRWILIPTVRLPGVTAPPVPPADLQGTVPDELTIQQSDAVYPPEVGDGSSLTRLSALLPNGCEVWDGAPVVDPVNRRILHHDRIISRGGGWVLTLDSIANDTSAWKNLKDKGGYQVTQILSMQREDGEAFSASHAMKALEAVRYAMALAVGRQTEAILLVGWHKEAAAWSRWSAGRVDPYRDVGTWLDSSITARQVGELIGRFLDSCADELRRDTLLYATSYYTQALGKNAEIGIASAISGLQLLGDSWFVEEAKTYTRGAWKELGAEGQIRAMLSSASCRVNTLVPHGSDHLAAVAKRLTSNAGQQKLSYDGLDCLIKMRNEVMHPSRNKRLKWTYEEWIEAHELAAHFLELALLAYVGYRGKYHPRTALNRYAGYVEDVPWLGC